MHANAAWFRYFESSGFVCAIEWPFPKPQTGRLCFPWENGVKGFCWPHSKVSPKQGSRADSPAPCTEIQLAGLHHAPRMQEKNQVSPRKI